MYTPITENTMQSLMVTKGGLRSFWGPLDVLTCTDICAFFSYL